jgi:hypothetical protein
VVRVKWEVVRLKAAFERFASTCLRNASNSGFASRGIWFGMTAAKDLTEDEGELQFSRGTWHESRGSVVGSTASPK